MWRTQIYLARDKLVLIFMFIEFYFSGGVHGAKILAAIPTPSYSHQIVFRPLWKALSARGHEITLITTDPDPSATNITQIDLSFTYELMQKLDYSGNIANNTRNFFDTMDYYLEVAKIVNTEIAKSEQIQNFLKSNTSFDLVMIEFLNSAMFSFAHKYKAPFIGILSLEMPYIRQDCVGNPTHPISNPDILLPFSGNLSFLERIISVFYSVYIRYYAQKAYEVDNTIVQEHYGKGFPSTETMAKNVDLVLVNANPILDAVRPNVPSVVYVGRGLQIGEKKPLPKDLQEFLDEGLNGVIYFSLGTNVKSKDLTYKLKQILIESFSELPYKVLWKFESSEEDNFPENVKVLNWMPQQDILRHPNIKLFITQGGSQSIDEAIYNHVPMIGMPFFADQPSNIQKIVDKGIALSVHHAHLEKEQFKSAVLEIMNNPKYRERIKNLSELVLDEPMTGLEKAIWWTEYVLRHKGAKHLRSHAIDIPFYQYYLLDVIGTAVFIILILIFVMHLFVKLICKSVFHRKFKLKTK